MSIVAAIDESDIAKSIVERAGSLGEAFDETVYVVHVLSRSDLSRQGRTSVKTGEDVDLDRIRAGAADVAADAIERIGSGAGERMEAVGLIGTPAEKILSYAQDRDARFVVVGSKKRSPAGKAVFGSTAQSIVLNADCPVVSVRPGRHYDGE